MFRLIKKVSHKELNESLGCSLKQKRETATTSIVVEKLLKKCECGLVKGIAFVGGVV